MRFCLLAGGKKHYSWPWRCARHYSLESWQVALSQAGSFPAGRQFPHRQALISTQMKTRAGLLHISGAAHWYSYVSSILCHTSSSHQGLLRLSALPHQSARLCLCSSSLHYGPEVLPRHQAGSMIERLLHPRGAIFTVA